MAVYDLAQDLLRRCPPWLRSRISGPTMLGMGDVIQAVLLGSSAGLKARFPTDDADPGALTLIGAERRIRRGPGEDAATYAARLRTWWDAHRRRASPYALLEQLWHYWRANGPPRIDVVAQSGLRHYFLADAPSSSDVVRDSIAWDGGGPAFGWAHVWVFFYVEDLISTIVTDDDEILVDQGGDEIVVSVPFAGALTADEEEDYRAVPREWSAAHVPYVTVVLLYTDPDTGAPARLWNYPQPITDTWTTHVARTWAAPVPVILVAA